MNLSKRNVTIIIAIFFLITNFTIPINTGLNWKNSDSREKVSSDVIEYSDNIQKGEEIEQKNFVYQPPNIEWYTLFGGTNEDKAYSVQQTSDGGYILVGETKSYGSGGSDGLLIKFDDSGVLEWYKTYGGSQHDYFLEGWPTNDGNYIMVGTYDAGSSDEDVWLVKADINGNQVFSKTYDKGSSDRGLSVNLCSDGGYIISAEIKPNFYPNQRRTWLIKTDANGVSQYNEVHGYNFLYAVCVCTSVIQTSDGKYVAAGYRNYQLQPADYDFWLLKVKSNLKKEWDHYYLAGGDDDIEMGFSVQQTSDGGYIISGNDLTNCKMSLVKTKYYGSPPSKDWSYQYGSGYPSINTGQSVIQTSNGGYVIAGSSNENDPDPLKCDVWLIKTNSVGGEEWSDTYDISGSPSNEYGYSVKQTSDGGYIIGGYVEIENQDSETLLLKLEGIVADADGPYEGYVGEPISFSGSASGGEPPYSWDWVFGDGGTSDEQNPSHEYANPGNYTVILTVTDDNGSVAIDTTWALIRESNDPPEIPTIDGETNGYYGEEYDYTFNTVDPDNDDVWYYIEWGDETNTGWIGPYESGREVVRSHIWNEQGDYTIRAKARDIFEAESEWGTLEVTMPVNQQSSHSIFMRFFNNGRTVNIFNDYFGENINGILHELSKIFFFFFFIMPIKIWF